MNPDAYWVTGVLEPIQKETERNAVSEAGSIPAGRPSEVTP